jgi:hypothetical protein
MTKSRSRLLAAAAGLAALLLSCGGDENDDNRILPLQASIEIQPVGTPSVVFLSQRSVSGDIVFLDIMLRPGGTLSFDAFGFAFRFDPSVIQVGVLKVGASSALSDPFATPFGNCGAAGDPSFCLVTTSSPLCADNTDPGSAEDANATGMLVIGVAANTGLVRVCSDGPTPGANCVNDAECGSGGACGPPLPACADAMASTETRLLTLSLTAASVGQSTFEFLPNATDLTSCKIWNDDVDLGVPCDAGMAVFRASR